MNKNKDNVTELLTYDKNSYILIYIVILTYVIYERRLDMKKYDVLIIGGGPATLSACRVFGNNNHDLSIGLVRQEDHSLIYCAMPYAVEGIIEPEKTFKSDKMVTDKIMVLN
ncbi:MAG: hypothetical protein PWQ94_1749 [Thermoanaerobacterium sp.]|nr:hypothetical protein [Thermoanaerobacterium sp.]